MPVFQLCDSSEGLMFLRQPYNHVKHMLGTVALPVLLMCSWSIQLLAQQPFILNPQVIDAGGGPKYVGVGDLNNDQRPDFIVSNYDGVGFISDRRLVSIQSAELGQYRIAQTIIVPKGAADVLCFDIDQDGDNDLVVGVWGSSNPEEHYLRVYLNQGDGIVELAYLVPNLGGIFDLQVHDFDDDGIQDLVALCHTLDANFVRVLLNDEAGQLTLARSIEVPAVARNIVFQDYDSDGKADFSLVYSDINLKRPYIDIYVQKNVLEYELSQSLECLSGGIGHCSADFDKNGHPDIALAPNESHFLQIFYQNADGSFQQPTSLRLGSSLSEVLTSDFDLDGDADLIVSEYSTGQINILLNPGDGNFIKEFGEYWITLTVLQRVRGLTLLYLDDDEYIDFAVGSLSKKTLNLFTNVIGKGSFAGRVFYNSDGACIEQDRSVGFGRQLVEFTPGPHYFVSSRNGHFGGFLQPGVYRARLADPGDWAEDCQSNDQEVLVPDSGNARSPVLFPLEAANLVRNLQVSIMSSRARPKRELQYVIYLFNHGTVPYTGQLKLNFDPRLEYISSSLPVESIDSGNLVWQLNDFLPGRSAGIVLSFKVAPSISRGDELCAKIEAEMDSPDPNSDHIDEICTEVTGSYDPNDIRVWPAGAGADGLVSPDVKTLSYMIRFQNTGNDTAFTVVLKNKLPENLNIRTIRLGASSHEYSVNVLRDNELEFTFNDILLPDSTTDLLGSQGYVKYRIDLKEELEPGTQIRNRAGIYFDFNPVVWTNEAITTIGQTSTSVNEFAAASSFRVFPNPATESVTIDGIDPAAGSLEVRDVLGRTVMTVELANQRNVQLQMKEFPAGVYFVRVFGSSVKETSVQLGKFKVTN